jgi:hypothetical protein
LKSPDRALILSYDFCFINSGPTGPGRDLRGNVLFHVYSQKVFPTFTLQTFLSMIMKIALAFLSVISMACSAQEAVLPSGGDASGIGGSLSYSVGQAAYTILSDGNHTIVQGVQQPYEISIVIGVPEVTVMENVQLFPNPTVNEIILNLNYTSGLYYKIIDVKGLLMESRLISSDQTIIDMSRYSPSTYLLQLIQGNNTIQTYQIIKN